MKTIIKKYIVLLIMLSIFIFVGCTENSIETSKGTLNKIETSKKNELTYVNITYDPTVLGKRAEDNLGEKATKYYKEILIPAVLNRKKEIDVPKDLTDNEKALIVNYFQQICPLEYFTGTPFFNVNKDKILFDYTRCKDMTEKEYKQLVNNMCKSIESIINNNIKENYNYFESVISLYRYLSQYTVYNKDAESTNAYGVLVNKEGTCCGFAQSIQILLSQLNLDEGYQVEWLSRDDIEGHVWNVLYVDEEWYYFDATWENGSTNGDGLIYFAMDEDRRSNDYLQKDEYTMSPLSLDLSVPTCNSNRFEIFKYCRKYKLDLDNHVVKIKNYEDNKWYILDTENYSIREV